MLIVSGKTCLNQNYFEKNNSHFNSFNTDNIISVATLST